MTARLDQSITIPCDHCERRGWRNNGGEWGAVCIMCGGAGVIRVSRLMGGSDSREYRGAVRLLKDENVKSETASRVLDRIIEKERKAGR